LKRFESICTAQEQNCGRQNDPVLPGERYNIPQLFSNDLKKRCKGKSGL
jgi:hypothetical protein